MQIVNYLRAKCFNSSDAAFSLAMKNNKYIPLAEKIILIKNVNMEYILKTNFSLRKEVLIECKVLKYNHLLKGISKIKLQPDPCFGTLGCKIPRVKLNKVNGNVREYFPPVQQSANITIPTAKE